MINQILWIFKKKRITSKIIFSMKAEGDKLLREKPVLERVVNLRRCSIDPRKTVQSTSF